jgi:hypothetical protein
MQLPHQSEVLKNVDDLSGHQSDALVKARRTAFVSRFIVLREAKRSRAHRTIELMEWEDDIPAEKLAERFRQVFVDNGDNMGPVDRDLRRAMAHSMRSLHYFIHEYSSRATASFVEALFDYERSNKLLFGDDEQPKLGGWRLPSELARARQTQAVKGVAHGGETPRVASCAMQSVSEPAEQGG